MNMLSLIIGAGAISVAKDAGKWSMSVGRMRIVRTIIILVAISLIVLMVFSSIQSLIDLKNSKDTIRNEFVDMNSRTNDRLADIILQLANISDRVSALEHPGSAPIPATFIGTKDKFTSSPYLLELQLFKSLSPAEQGEYLSLSQSGKSVKYGYAFR